MDDNLNNLEESDTFIEDISDESLLTLDETLESDMESDLSEGSCKTKMEADDEEDDMEDDGEGLDKPGSEDSDIDNDGDSDESDEYLKNRRKAIAKSMKKEDVELEEGEYLKSPADDYDLEMDDLSRDRKIITKLDAKAIEALLKYYDNKSAATRLSAYGNGVRYKGYINAFKKRAVELGIREDVELEEASEKTVSIDADITYKVGSAAADKFIASMKSKGVNVTLKDAGNTTQAKLSGPKSVLRAWATQHYGREDAEDMEPQLFKEASVSSEDITRLVESEEGLSEEFKEKAVIIFEAAVSSKVSEIEASLQESYETRLLEETETIKSTLEEQVDSYLTYAVETWMEDNKVAIESSLRTQIAENFIGALKNVFVEHYVEVPDSKVDLFDQLEKENVNLKEEAAKASRIADRLANRVDTLVREKIIAEASIGLADTQADKLKKLAEDIEFVDEDTFSKKVETIKEFYLTGNSNDSSTTLKENADNSYFSTETIVEEDTSDVSPEMKQYLNALSRMNRAMTADLV